MLQRRATAGDQHCHWLGPRTRLAASKPLPRAAGRSIASTCVLSARSGRAAWQRGDLLRSVTTGTIASVTNIEDAQGDHHTTSETAAAASQYNWLQQWWPVMSVELMHKDKPNAVTILGRQLVVWWDQPQAQWVVMEDSCPHRLTPLSQGRIVSPGQLTCSYHGWSFNAKGSCTTIPHLPADQPTISKRSCVRTYPSRMVDELLFAWLDNSPQGIELSQTKMPPISEGSNFKGWGVQLMPNDCRVWMEQGMDPGHANFLHHGLGFKSEDSVPIEAQPVADLSLEDGFLMQHGGYEKKNVGMVAKRLWRPPYLIDTEYTYPSGMSVNFNVFYVPVQHGTCRVFMSMKFGKATPPTPVTPPTPASSSDSADAAQAPPPTPAKQPSPSPIAQFKSWLGWLKSWQQHMPHWWHTQHMIADQDIIAMHLTERAMQDRGQTDRDFYLAAPADVGIAALNKWLRLAGYEELWGRKPAPIAHLTLEQLLDRRTRHTDHCAVCQKGLRLAEKVSAVLKALSFAFGAGAAGLWAVALVPGGPGLKVAAAAVAATLLAAAAAVARQKVEWEKEDRFLSGVKAWRKVGGLSLVPEK